MRSAFAGCSFIGWALLGLPVGSAIAEVTAVDASRLTGLRAILDENPALARDAYVQLGLGVLDSFEGSTRNGGPVGREDAWSALQTRELNRVLQWTEDRVQALLRRNFQPWAPLSGSPAVFAVEDGLLTVSSGAGRRACWLGGYGVWGTAAASLREFPALGVSLIQQERGPAGLLENGELTEGARSIVDVLESATENGVMVDLLLSPHYMPEWAAGVEGVSSIARRGHIGYSIDHPAARRFVEQWIRTIVPMVKDSPALFSLCLSNEPEYANSGRDPHSRAAWVAFLAGRHGSIDALNTLHGTSHRRFEEVSIPGSEVPEEADTTVRRAFFDWACFNHRHVADWHRWMNGIIKSIAPEVRTHVKAMRALSPGHQEVLAYLPDPELLCEITDLAGCDTWATLPAHEGPDEWWWRGQSLYYDLLHAFRGQPVFDSESHLVEIPYGPVPVPPSQTRCALWQGALHHRAATVLWVWEPWVESVADLQGTIYHRPANIYAAGRTMLDLNRLAGEVAAVNRVRPKVALLYSIPSVFWEADYTQAVQAAYTALLFMGLPVTFVTERQLGAGSFSPPNSEVDWIIVPRGTHVTDGAYRGLEAFVQGGGRVIRIGSDCLAWDEYHRRRTLTLGIKNSVEIPARRSERDMMVALGPALAAGGLDRVGLLNRETGEPAWKVEYQVIPHGGNHLVPLVNYGDRMTVALDLAGTATDLLNGGAVALDQVVLEPMEPRLLLIHR